MFSSLLDLSTLPYSWNTFGCVFLCCLYSIPDALIFSFPWRKNFLISSFLTITEVMKGERGSEPQCMFFSFYEAGKVRKETITLSSCLRVHSKTGIFQLTSLFFNFTFSDNFIRGLTKHLIYKTSCFNILILIMSCFVIGYQLAMRTKTVNDLGIRPTPKSL